jgi:hypothetical protein
MHYLIEGLAFEVEDIYKTERNIFHGSKVRQIVTITQERTTRISASHVQLRIQKFKELYRRQYLSKFERITSSKCFL